MSTAGLDDIAAKVAEGQALTDADAEALASTYDIVSLGIVADDARRARHGTRTTFLRVAHVLATACQDGPDTWPQSAREVRVDAPFIDIEHARAAVRGAAVTAGHALVSGFSLADLEHAAGGDVMRVRTWMDDLRDAGLGLIDEAPIDVLTQPAALIMAAEASALPVARVTVHAGHAGGPLSLIRLVAALQAETNAVRVFAPIPRHPGGEPTTGYEDVKAVALARILLATVPHIQADWTLHGPKLAQVAITFGADDMDNVSPLDAVAEGRRRAPLEEIRRNIRAAGFEAIERDPRFAFVG
jgi:aminodeoxyfutalosine synthase